jgi:hypothetical protein
MWVALSYLSEEVKIPRGQSGTRINSAANRRTVWAIQIGAKLEGDVGEVALNGDGHCTLEGRPGCKDYHVSNKNNTTTTATSTTPI